MARARARAKAPALSIASLAHVPARNSRRAIAPGPLRDRSMDGEGCSASPCVVLGDAADAAADKEIDNAEVLATYCIVLQLRAMYSGPCCLQLVGTASSPCVYSTCYANKGSNTASSDTVSVTKVNWKYGNMLNADTIIIDVAGRPPPTLYTDQLADEKGGLKANAPYEITSAKEYTCPLELQGMLKEECVDHYNLSDRLAAKIFPKVARVNKPVSSSEVDAEFGVSAYSKHGTRTVSTLLRVLEPSQVWVLFLVILLLVPPVHSLTHDESAEIGTCCFDKTSVATLSCKQPDGNWRPPSVTCCNAFLNAIDHLPASNESGACCLCRYLQLRYPNGHGLVSSYVLCQGKDMHIVTTWSSFPIRSCHTVCGQEKTSSSGMSNPVQKNHPVGNVHGTGNKIFKIPWLFGSVAVCVILCICLWYLWLSKPASNACQLQSLPLNRSRRLSSQGDPRTECRRSSERRSSAQLKERRMSYS